MFFINGTIINADFKLETLDMEIDKGKIIRVQKSIDYKEDDMVIDCEGYYISPGFVDIHTHGAAGFDCSDGYREAVEGVAEFLITKGVTSFCPTTMTMDKVDIIQAVRVIKGCMDKPCKGARVLGINMEGPFISPEKSGAQAKESITEPDYDYFREVYEASGKNIKIVDIAPEINGGSLIRKFKRDCVVSMAHTTVDYAGALEAMDKGASHITHLFNAMSGLSHREPGLVGAALDDSRVTCELICDGYHIHPAVLRTAFAMLKDRAVIISDSMRGSGMPDGEKYELGGQTVNVSKGKATLADGTIAGSVTNIHQEIKNLVSYGIPLEQAVKSATIIPAKVVGMEKEIGSIEVGKCADLVMLDKDLEIVGVYHS